MHISKGEKTFDIFNSLLLTLIGLSTLFPFLHVIAKSFSGDVAITRGVVTLFPVDFQIGTYKYVLSQGQFLNSFRVSVFVTVVGTLLSMFMTVMAAYPLSKPHLKGRKLFVMMYVFVMLFSGGMVPKYLLMKSLHLLNNIWVLVLPHMIAVFNLLIVKTFFEELPESVEESARIDGASNIRILFSIVLPMSLPVLASVGLFYAVGYWNNYMSAVLYITKPNLKPLQQYLYDLITSSLNTFGTGTNIDPDAAMSRAPDAVRASTIVVSTLPILCVYPYLQKYFVKGITIGSVKG